MAYQNNERENLPFVQVCDMRSYIKEIQKGYAKLKINMSKSIPKTYDDSSETAFVQQLAQALRISNVFDDISNQRRVCVQTNL